MHGRPQSGFKLTVAQGPSPGQEVELLKADIVIGRDPNADIVFNSPVVSRRHARLIRDSQGYQVEDLGSSNGTFLNDQKLIGRSRLQPGDQIRFGQAITLVYSAPKPRRASLDDLPIQEQEVVGGVAATMIAEQLPGSAPTTPPQLLVTVAGRDPLEYTLTREAYTLGRAPDNDIVINSQIVSRHHARIERVDGSYRLAVLQDASNPVFFEGRALSSPKVLRHKDTLRIGSLDPGMMVTLSYQSPSEAEATAAHPIYLGEKTLLQIGRDPTNDVVLNVPTVSRYHAQIERIGQRYRVRDLRSSNGTFVNDQRVEGDVWLKPDDTIRIGLYRFVMGEDHLAQFDDTKGLRVEAIGLNKWVRKDLNILKNISAVFQPREFIVVVGQSGGGKSTLIDAIAGYRPATHGRVLVNDIEVYKNFDAIRNEIGFVPQKDIIHMELTVYQALDYSAQLRMPPDTTKQERHQRIMEVLDDLDLTHRKDVQISGLSGGQQKRVSIGVELLTKPGLFFLDEPTSGLDPGTETALMQLMRRLADQGRTIVLITHATKNVMLADKVIFLARGGYLAWFGPPDEALKYFDRYRSERDRRAHDIEFDEIYAILDDPSLGSAEQWAERYQAHPAYQKNIVAQLERRDLSPPTNGHGRGLVKRQVGRNRRQVSALRQFFILSARNLKILTRDRFGLILMLAAAPIVSLLDVLLAVLLGRDPFSFTDGSLPNVMITLFLLTIYGIMVGGLAQMREIVKEQDIYKRERLVNLKIAPYVMSKIWVAALLALYQSAVYVIVHYLAFDMPGGVLEFVFIYITLALATMSGMMLGLFASALAPNANSAPLIIILLMLPQIVLGGALIPLPEFVSAPTSSRWAFEAFMGITGVGSDVAADVCWDLPEAEREAMSIEDKSNFGCNCMGLNMLNPDNCSFPGLGEFYNPAIDQPPPEEPAALRPPPPEPTIPPRPVEPENQADQVAMAEFFAELKTWEAEVNQIQAQYKSDLESYQAEADVYKAEAISYQEALATWQIARAAAVEPAEGVVGQFNKDFGWTFVNKANQDAYLTKIGTTWVAQAGISVILFVAILFLQKRKDA